MVKGLIGGDVCFVLGIIRKGSSFQSWVMPVDDIIPRGIGAVKRYLLPRVFGCLRVFLFLLMIFVRMSKHGAWNALSRHWVIFLSS